MNLTSRRVLKYASLFLIYVLGCGGPKIVQVRGTLTYKGLPVQNAIIDFTPESGRASNGVTDEQGRFTLKYTNDIKGVVIGKYKLSIQRKLTPDEELAKMQGIPIVQIPEMLALFDKYSYAQSTKFIEITKAETDLKIELE